MKNFIKTEAAIFRMQANIPDNFLLFLKLIQIVFNIIVFLFSKLLHNAGRPGTVFGKYMYIKKLYIIIQTNCLW